MLIGLNPLEKNFVSNGKSTRYYNNCIQSNSLTELGNIGTPFTWHN